MTIIYDMITAQNSESYPSPAGITVDPVVFTLVDNKLHVLLVKRENELYALPGGFLGDSEQPEDTVKRKLEEKTGVKNAYLEKLSFHATLNRDKRGWIPSLSYIALTNSNSLPENSDAKWTNINELPEIAFDHHQIIKEGLTLLQNKILDLQLFLKHATSLLENEFTLGQCWTVYQQITIAGQNLTEEEIAAWNKTAYANFRRDLLKTNLIEPTGNSSSSDGGRPAKTYKLTKINTSSSREKQI